MLVSFHGRITPLPTHLQPVKSLYRQLLRAEPKSKAGARSIAAGGGVYAFFDGDECVYVGRTRDERELRERVKYQFRGGSPSDPSNLSKNMGPAFHANRDAIANWMVRTVPVPCPRLRLKVEAYAILCKDPRYNRG